MGKDPAPSTAIARDLFEDSSGFDAPLGAPPPASLHALEVALPASVLIVDEDGERGAHTATKLLERGYTCRWVTHEQMGEALRQQSFDALLVEVDPQSRPDALSAAEAFSGGVVVSSPAVVKLEADGGILLLKPWLAHQAIRALEESRRRASASAHGQPAFSPASSPRLGADDATERTELDPETRAAAEEPATDGVSSTEPVPEAPYVRVSDERAPSRAPLKRSPSRPLADASSWQNFTSKVVRARITDRVREGSGLGRIRRARYDGQLEVEARRPVGPQGCPIRAELILRDGRALAFPGNVELDGAGFVLLALEVEAAEVPFFHAWIGESSDLEAGPVEAARITALEAPLPRSASHAGEETADVEALWASARAQLDADELQQRFIQVCLRKGAIEFAVERYRALKEAHPEDPRPQRYLEQVGTILSFYALKQNAEPEEDGLSLRLKLVLGAFILSAVILFVMAALLR